MDAGAYRLFNLMVGSSSHGTADVVERRHVDGRDDVNIFSPFGDSHGSKSSLGSVGSGGVRVGGGLYGCRNTLHFTKLVSVDLSNNKIGPAAGMVPL